MLSKEEIEKIYKANYMQNPFEILTEENLQKLEEHCKKSIHYERGKIKNEHEVTLCLIYRYLEQREKINKLNKINNEMVDSFFRLYQERPGTMHKFFENGKPCEYGYDKETNECKEINCKPCIKQYFEKKVEGK